MKNARSFLVALLTSVFIYVSANLFNKINSAFEPAGLFINILQLIFIIKCIVLIICVMPSRVDLRQSAYGYLVTNFLIISYHISINGEVVFPVFMVVFQGFQIIGYLILQGRLKVLVKDMLRIPTKTERLTEHI